MLRKILQALFRPLTVDMIITKKKISCCSCNKAENKFARWDNEKMMKIVVGTFGTKSTIHLCLKHAHNFRSHVLNLNLSREEL